MAPVVGSGDCPAWMARVENPWRLSECGMAIIFSMICSGCEKSNNPVTISRYIHARTFMEADDSSCLDQLFSLPQSITIIDMRAITKADPLFAELFLYLGIK